MEIHAAHIPESASVIAGYGIAIANALEYSGVDPQRVFLSAGIDQTLCNDPLQRLPVTAISRLYEACVEVTRDPYFGLTVAKFLHASNLHALGYGLLASSTLLDFCQRLERYMRLVSHTARMEIREQGDEAQLASYKLYDACPQTQDAWTAFLYRTMRLLHGGELKLLRVEFVHALPDEGAEPYVKFFGVPVLFGYPATVLAFDRSALRTPLPGACLELAQFNDNIVVNYLAKLDRNDVVACARAQIIELLPSGACSKNRVAAALCMSSSTLQARLAQRGSSFNDLLNATREDLARTYLSQPALSVTEIAYRLGFTDLSNFTRAFKRWTGQSPSEYRQD